MDDRLQLMLGAAAREARGRAGLTQAEVARRVGMSPAVYSRLECGKMMPSVPRLWQLSTVLGISSDALLGFPPSSELTAWVAPDEPAHEPPELRRMTRQLRKLSPSDLRVLQVLATALASR